MYLMRKDAIHGRAHRAAGASRRQRQHLSCPWVSNLYFIKVLDFGLVKTREQDQATDATETRSRAAAVLASRPNVRDDLDGRPRCRSRADVYARCVASTDGSREHVSRQSYAVLLDPATTASPSKRLGAVMPRRSTLLGSIVSARTRRSAGARQLLNRINALICAMIECRGGTWWQDQLPKPTRRCLKTELRTLS